MRRGSHLQTASVPARGTGFALRSVQPRQRRAHHQWLHRRAGPELFDEMVHFLSRRRLLTRILLDGVIHSHMLLILDKVVNGRIPRHRDPLARPANPGPGPLLGIHARLPGWHARPRHHPGTQRLPRSLDGRQRITSRSIFLYDSAKISPPAAFRVHHLQAPPQAPAASRPDLLPFEELNRRPSASRRECMHAYVRDLKALFLKHANPRTPGP